MASTLIWLNAGVFVVYGLACVIAPETVATFFTDGSPSTSSAMIDFRATYGGVSIAVGLLLASLARDQSTHTAGLRALAPVMLCMAAGRTVGIVADGDPNAWMFVFLAVELGVAAWAFALLRSRPGVAV